MKLKNRAIQCLTRVSRSRIFSHNIIAINIIMKEHNPCDIIDYKDDIDYRIMKKYIDKVPCRICEKFVNIVYIHAHSMILNHNIMIVLCKKCVANPIIAHEKARRKQQMPYDWVRYHGYTLIKDVSIHIDGILVDRPFQTMWGAEIRNQIQKEENKEQKAHKKYENLKKYEIRDKCYKCVYCKHDVSQKDSIQRKYVICKDGTIVFAHTKCLTQRKMKTIKYR